MILNLSFSNYRSFKDECVFTTETTKSNAKMENVCYTSTLAEKSKPVLAVSMIFGANGSGKSNIIKFLYGMTRWVKNIDIIAGEKIPLYDPFKFNEDSVSEPTTFSIEFIANKLRYIYELSFDGKSVRSEQLKYYPKGRVTVLYERVVSEDDTNTHTISFGSSVTGIKAFKVFRNQLLLSKFITDTPAENITEAATYLSNIVIYNGYYEDTIKGRDKELFKWLADEPLYKEMLLNMLLSYDFDIQGFEIKKAANEYEVQSVHNLYKDGQVTGTANLPLKDESIGTRTFFICACLMLRALKDGYPFFADELDSGLHTKLTEAIVNMFRSKSINTNNSQIIFTTHDTCLLDISVRKDQIWFIGKDEFGVSELYALSDYEDVREDTPFEKWYLNNKFGAVPNIVLPDNLLAKDGKTE